MDKPRAPTSAPEPEPLPIVPPDILSKEDFATMRTIRTDIWKNAFYGIGVGSLGGFVAHTAYQKYYSSSKQSLPRNSIMASILAGGALGSFLLATTAGKNQVHHLHPIFENGKLPPQKTPAEEERQIDESIRNAKLAMMQRKPTRVELINNRVQRRKSLADHFKGHGLSDSHGGHWVRDDQDTTTFTIGQTDNR